MTAAVPPLPSAVRPLLPRTLFNPEHEDFRRSVRRFIAEEISPHHER
jgi:hypothetical protein